MFVAEQREEYKLYNRRFVDMGSILQHFPALVNADPLHEVAQLRYQELCTQSAIDFNRTSA